MSIKNTIARNTVFNAAGRAWEAAINVTLTVYIVRVLQFDGYGLWSLVAVFTSYAAMVDFGVGSAYAKYIAEHAARREDDEVSAIVSTGAAFYAVLGGVVVAAGWFAIDVLVDGVLHLLRSLHPDQAGRYAQPGGTDDIRFLFRGALVLFALTNIGAPFAAVPQGLQRMGITNVLSFFASWVKLGATILFLQLGYGVRGLLFANGVVLLFFLVTSIVAAFVVLPGLRLGPGYVRRVTFGRLFQFGWRTQVAKLSNLINFQTDRVVVGLVFGDLTLVGLYRAGEDLAAKIRQGPALLVSALIPAVSDLDARDEREKLALLYKVATKYIAVVTVPATVFVIGAADMLLHTLFGEVEGLTTAGWVLRILVAGYALNLLPGPGVSIALGRGRPQLPMAAGLISMAANIALTIAFVTLFGFYGVATATSLAMAVSTVWFLRALRATTGVGPLLLLDTAVRWPLLASLPGLVVCVVVDAYLAGAGTHLPNAAGLAVSGSVFALTYLALLRFFPFLTAFDVAFLEKTLYLGKLPGFGFLVDKARHA